MRGVKCSLLEKGPVRSFQPFPARVPLPPDNKYLFCWQKSRYYYKAGHSQSLPKTRDYLIIPYRWYAYHGLGTTVLSRRVRKHTQSKAKRGSSSSSLSLSPRPREEEGEEGRAGYLSGTGGREASRGGAGRGEPGLEKEILYICTRISHQEKAVASAAAAASANAAAAKGHHNKVPVPVVVY